MMYIIRDREAGNEIEYTATYEEAEKIVRAYEDDDKAHECYTEDFYEIVELDKDTLTYQVEYTDYNNGTTSPFEVVEAKPNYSAEDYISDFKTNADDEYLEMLEHGTFRVYLAV